MFICPTISLLFSVMLLTHSRVMDSTGELPCGSLPQKLCKFRNVQKLYLFSFTRSKIFIRLYYLCMLWHSNTEEIWSCIAIRLLSYLSTYVHFSNKENKTTLSQNRLIFDRFMEAGGLCVHFWCSLLALQCRDLGSPPAVCCKNSSCVTFAEPHCFLLSCCPQLPPFRKVAPRVLTHQLLIVPPLSLELQSSLINLKLHKLLEVCPH